jgi:hypothetical protein
MLRELAEGVIFRGQTLQPEPHAMAAGTYSKIGGSRTGGNPHCCPCKYQYYELGLGYIHSWLVNLQVARWGRELEREYALRDCSGTAWRII